MNRRESLACLTALAAHAMFPTVLQRFAAAASAVAPAVDTWRPEFLSVEQGQVLAEVVETIIPETDTPGAKAARVHVFIDLMLKDCVAPAEQAEVRRTLDTLGEGFLKATPLERQAQLQKTDSAGIRLMKELTLVGYFTSEIGATKALAYVAVPGEYRGCLDLTPAQRAWATR
jgi:Gluconate 2-dehydrogenase subunit 3